MTAEEGLELLLFHLNEIRGDLEPIMDINKAEPRTNFLFSRSRRDWAGTGNSASGLLSAIGGSWSCSRCLGLFDTGYCKCNWKDDDSGIEARRWALAECMSALLRLLIGSKFYIQLLISTHGGY